METQINEWTISICSYIKMYWKNESHCKEKKNKNTKSKK